MKLKLYAALALVIVMMMSACGKSDSDLQKAVNDKLAAEKVTGITATVKDGVATLTGEVTNITVKTSAETAVKSVEGIKSVTNNINVKTPVATPPPADPMVQGKLDEALKKAGCTGATAKVENGTIMLTGTVPAAKYAECIQAAQESGAGKLDNQLQKGK
jgi:hyperosmotically inducible protein